MAKKVFSNSRVNMFSNTLKQQKRTLLFVVDSHWNFMRDHVMFTRDQFMSAQFLNETNIENYAISNELSIELSNISVKPIHEHRQVSRIPIGTVEWAKNKSRKVRMSL